MASHRVNVNFSDHAYHALEELSSRTGKSMSEVLRESIVLYGWYIESRAQGSHILIENKAGAIRELLSI